jgi:hypothetical protein
MIALASRAEILGLFLVIAVSAIAHLVQSYIGLQRQPAEP